MTRDRIENALRRLHTTHLHTGTIDVFEPDVAYSQGDGFDVSYPGFPDSPDGSYNARVESPSGQPEKDRQGTESEADVIVRIRDDTGQQWTGWGESGEAGTHIRDTVTGIRYEVQDVDDLKDGLTKLEGVEV